MLLEDVLDYAETVITNEIKTSISGHSIAQAPETFKRELKPHLYKSLVEGIMCHSIHYFTIVFNISLLQYVQLVSNVSLSCILYMLLPFDVGIIYLLDVNKCIHLVSGGIHSTLLEILLWSAIEQVTGN